MDSVTLDNLQDQTEKDNFVSPPTSEIKKLVLEIVNSTLPEAEKLESYKASHPWLFKYYPTLFKMACKGVSEFNMTHFKYMLGMMTNIENNDITEQSASEEVGQKFFNQYVAPIVGTDAATLVNQAKEATGSNTATGANTNTNTVSKKPRKK